MSKEEDLIHLICTNGSSFEEYLNSVNEIENINYRDKLFKRSFLHAAIENGRKDIISDLLKRKIDVNIKDKKGNTALIYLLSFDQWDLFKDMLLKYNVDVHSTNNFGNGLLWNTIMATRTLESKEIQYELVKLLLEKGANPLSKNIYDKTPLELAINEGNKKLVDLIKSYVKDI